MVFKIDFRDDTVLEWTKTPDGVTIDRNDTYTPTMYVDAPTEPLRDLRNTLETDPKITRMTTENWATSLHKNTTSPVLRIGLDRIDAVTQLAREIRHTHERGNHAPGTFRLFNVDFTPEFRYCLETQTDPTPRETLDPFTINISEKALADRDITTLEIEGHAFTGEEDWILTSLRNRLDRSNPDVLVTNTADVIPLLYEKAHTYDIDPFDLGRLPGWQRLAGHNTYESYGRVGHSPARYNVPGRVILDRSNSFLYHHSSFSGLIYLVEQSWKPLQETGWASIGNVLTAIQIREAVTNRRVLIPWNKWEPEVFKDVRTLHAADRGGFTFEPMVGFHENVYEVDFAALYPNIICEENISPDTILCECHPDRKPIPELDYNLCTDDGFLPAVLGPLLDDREGFKQTIQDPPDPETKAECEAKSSAIKWILVSCFGYQGYKNSKFGRIECHEAINAVARDILLTAKEICETNQWEIVHGIVDSLWIRPATDDAPPIEYLAEQITTAIGITLEFERQYDWICFVPKRQSNNGALTKYFGKITETDEYKFRGIEVRQRSTPSFIETTQREFIDALDRHRDPNAVCDILQRYIHQLRAHAVPPEDLVIRQRVSKRPEEYAHNTRTVAALHRYHAFGVDRYPGQDVRYVVVNDEVNTRNRVKAHFEDIDRYDAEFYVDLLIRACESIISPLGWHEPKIRQYLQTGRDMNLQAFEQPS